MSHITQPETRRRDVDKFQKNIYGLKFFLELYAISLIAGTR